MRTRFDKIATRFWTPKAPRRGENRLKPIRVNPSLSFSATPQNRSQRRAFLLAPRVAALHQETDGSEVVAQHPEFLVRDALCLATQDALVGVARLD